MIPDQLRKHLENTLGVKIASGDSVSGGSINRAARLRLKDGRTCFLKWNTSADPKMFVVEKKGLALLASADTDIRIPDVFAAGQTEGGTGFLVQEFIEEGRKGAQSAARFGQELASLHKHSSEQFGLDHDNFIGRLPQSNTRHSDWTTFFIEERMSPQLKMAVDDGKINRQTVDHFNSMYKQLPDIFPGEPPSLLHGDLWGGNFFYDSDGNPAIYDPAVYYGHREMELAFTYLFGGFSNDFYAAYENAWPLEAGFNQRKDIYNLYPLLVHTNLFGGSYGRRVENIVNRF